MFVDRTVPRICREYERFTFAREMRQELIAELEHAADEGVLPEDHSRGDGFSDSHHGRPGRGGHAPLGPAYRGECGALVNDVLNVTLAGLKTGVALESDSEMRPLGTR